MESLQTLNMKSVTIKQFLNFIEEQLIANELAPKTGIEVDLQPIMGIGKSGVGKTECIYGLTRKRKIGFCEMRLVNMSETDINGIPTIVTKGGIAVTEWAQNGLLPKSRYNPETEKWEGFPKEEGGDGVTGLLVLDEITSAQPSVRATVYQLLDSKRAIGNYHLPEGWLVIALGNGPDDGGVFMGAEAASFSRCRCLRVEPDFESWRTWALANDMHPAVLSFLRKQPDTLHLLNPDAGPEIFPCPRTWASLAKKINNQEVTLQYLKGNSDKPLVLDIEAVEVYAAACLGDKLAAEFASYYAYSSKVISIEDILSGKAKGKDAQGVEDQAIRITIQSLIRTLKKELQLGRSGVGKFSEEVYVKACNAARWLVALGDISLDYTVMGMRDLGQSLPDFCELLEFNMVRFNKDVPEYAEFSSAHAAAII